MCVCFYAARIHSTHTWIERKKAMSSRVFPPSRQETIEAEGCVISPFCLHDIHTSVYTYTYIHTHRHFNEGKRRQHILLLQTPNVQRVYVSLKLRRRIDDKHKHKHTQLRSYFYTKYTQSDRKLFSFIYFLLCFHFFLI